MPRPFTSKDFANEAVINLMSRLVKIPKMISANREQHEEKRK